MVVSVDLWQGRQKVKKSGVAIIAKERSTILEQSCNALERESAIGGSYILAVHKNTQCHSNSECSQKI